jgi:hypothetical protein
MAKTIDDMNSCLQYAASLSDAAKLPIVRSAEIGIFEA